jgi:hypothetical protein
MQQKFKDTSYGTKFRNFVYGLHGVEEICLPLSYSCTKTLNICLVGLILLATISIIFAILDNKCDNYAKSSLRCGYRVKSTCLRINVWFKIIDSSIDLLNQHVLREII